MKIAVLGDYRGARAPSRTGAAWRMAPHGVGVSVPCPGLVATPLHETKIRAGSGMPTGTH